MEAKKALEAESPLRAVFARPVDDAATRLRRKRARRRRAVFWWFFDLWGYLAVGFFALLLAGLLFAFIAAFTGQLK
ncbi:MAG: hypothetical protein ABR548_05740 [Actinomycetota bacterium]|nr:hypothetical protein [Actinomycetota bacterium]